MDPTLKPPAIQNDLEKQFILKCLSAFFYPGTMEALPWEPRLDWEKPFSIAQSHRVLPLLYEVILDRYPEIAEKPYFEKWREAFHRNVHRNLIFTSELLEILGWLEAEGIEAVPFKGPALAYTAYGDPGRRQFDDLDLLLHKKDIFKAEKILRGKGYKPLFEWTASGQQAAFFERDCEAYWSAPGRAPVELHWEFAPKYFSFPYHDSGLWERSALVPFGGRKIRVFSNEDLLIILCAHGGKHGWSRLQWICDIAALLKSSKDLNWPRLIEKARAKRGLRLLLLGLCLLRDFFQIDLPQEIVRQIEKDKAVRGLSAEVFAGFSNSTDKPRTISAESHRFNLKSKDSLWDQCRYVWNLALTPTVADIQSVRLPAGMSFGYYLIRPFRGVLRRFKGLASSVIPA